MDIKNSHYEIGWREFAHAGNTNHKKMMRLAAFATTSKASKGRVNIVTRYIPEWKTLSRAILNSRQEFCNVGGGSKC